MTRQDIQAFQHDILSWYEKHQRDLPWRQDREPYHILVSEIMLQQTQVNRVIPKYKAWLKEFPTVQRLASAKTSEVLRVWSGLGYNRRALYLQKTAKELVATHKGIWPKTVKELKKLPGVGEYTARAIACFAFDEQIAVVDTNIRKVILTKFLQKANSRQQTVTDKKVQKIADQLLPKGKAYEWNQALMDYAGAVLRTAKVPLSRTKQSPFRGSSRYYRGQTVKLLLQYHVLRITQLAKMLEKDRQFVEKLVKELEKDGFIQQHGNYIRLA